MTRRELFALIPLGSLKFRTGVASAEEGYFPFEDAPLSFRQAWKWMRDVAVNVVADPNRLPYAAFALPYPETAHQSDILTALVYKLADSLNERYVDSGWEAGPLPIGVGDAKGWYQLRDKSGALDKSKVIAYITATPRQMRRRVYNFAA